MSTTSNDSLAAVPVAVPTAAPQPPRRRPPGRRRESGRLFTALFTYFITLLILIPLLWILLLSLEPNDTILNSPLSFTSLSFRNYSRALTSLPLLRMYGNTLLLAVVSVPVGAAVSFMASFGLVTMVFKRRRTQSTLRFYILSGLAVPIYILLFPVYKIDLALGLYGTYWSLIIPYVAIAIPFNTLLLTGFLREFPKEIEEAAILDGVGLWSLCVRVVIPLMKPIIATIFIFNIIYVFNEFPFASILITDSSKSTLALAISQFQGQYSVDYGAMMAAAMLILVPQVVIYFIFQKQVIAGLTVGAVKG